MEASPLLKHPYALASSPAFPQQSPQQQALQQQQTSFPPGPLPSFAASPSHLAGQKRDSMGVPVNQPGPAGPVPPKLQESSDGGSFAKLFVGSVPKTITEEEVRPMFAEHGNVLEVAIVRDKRTGQQQGCCFIKYSTIEEAERAIKAIHNRQTLPGGTASVQVRFADGERERLGNTELPAFIGCLLFLLVDSKHYR